MAVESKLSAIVANQLGSMQGALEVQVQQQLQTELVKFANQCPPADVLKTVIDIRNNLLNVTNLFRNKTSKFQNFTSRLESIVQTLRTILTILRTIPIPTSVPPGVGVPIALTNKYAEVLFNILRFLESVEKDIQSINSLVASINPFLNNVRNSLSTLDSLITNCTRELSQEEQSILNSLTQIPVSIGSAGQSRTIEFRSDSGIDYTIEIISETDSDLNTPLRRAVAKNNNGVVVLRGEKSYSSDTEVLVDELKFRINNQLP